MVKQNSLDKTIYEIVSEFISFELPAHRFLVPLIKAAKDIDEAINIITKQGKFMIQKDITLAMQEEYAKIKESQEDK